ncbi:MAG: hypothetical protein MJ230_07555 [bacterium]|nr:hypothetical protein [bacterium]
MYRYDYKSTVSKNESEALKELIFNRARERAKALNNDTQENYTTSFKNELMDIARDSFNSSKNNPFAQINESKISNQMPEIKEEKKEIGFPERKISENLKAEIEYKSKLIKENASQDEIKSIMKDAGMDFENKKNFIGALNFLNTQASLSIVNKRTKGFEAIA